MTGLRTSWKRVTYTACAPVYNLLVWPLSRMRRASIQRLDLRPGEKVLIVGAGTGLDLDYLPSGTDITAIDLTPAMLARLRRRAERLGLAVNARILDGHTLDFPDNSFDAAILHLILAVIPDPVRCVREVARVLRPGGRAVIMDKFIPDKKRTPAIAQMLNPVLDFLGTNVSRKLGPILAGSGLEVVRDEPAGFFGYFRIVLTEKTRA
ncbi:MAG TPA: methyltransferase domain-containing protein [Phycisphaerae bacterium]|jgi:phosphatidylethanolamine/phosphatidyl-N-methylethanolamine N-methyltransferase|nr:methyltransferase domain-containing protein [Phycisphaerae bacterium]HOB76118.1 methyltransferase domain-containing protein [Phycisphaerae bacterium]HOJ56025.1 methyltransferase domain-containing protein [Phycisphaerae bacterium]HOL27106.1 methyltransferase domain-containing protein [Phycisphaerae bacterium]HPP21239.1 methyltransferase domain-containing protein [Phycisphaerae bacterium]